MGGKNFQTYFATGEAVFQRWSSAIEGLWHRSGKRPVNRSVQDRHCPCISLHGSARCRTV